MDITLVPGRWRHGSSWDGVVAAITAAGHRTWWVLAGTQGKGVCVATWMGRD